MRLPLVLASLSLLIGTAAAQQMAITFDDLPAAGEKPPNQSRLQIAQSLLATFRDEHLPPVYGFVNGVRTQQAPETRAVLTAWRAAGNPLGSHTWSHPDLESMSAAEFERDAAQNEALLRQYMPGDGWKVFRYPFLHEGESVSKHREVRAWLQARGYTIAEVTMDFEDYLWNEPYVRCMAKGDTESVARLHDSYLATAASYAGTYQTLARNLYGRDIAYVLLLHANAFNARMLPELLAMYRSRGFHFVTLEQAQKDAAYAEDPDFGYPGGGALTEQLTAKRKLKFPPNSKPNQELEATCR